MTTCVNGITGGGWGRVGVGFHFPPAGSNAKNKNKSPILIPMLFHEVIKTIVCQVFKRSKCTSEMCKRIKL